MPNNSPGSVREHFVVKRFRTVARKSSVGALRSCRGGLTF